MQGLEDRDTLIPHTSSITFRGWLFGLWLAVCASLPGQCSPLAELPFYDDFEGGVLREWWSANSTGEGRIRVTSNDYPHSGKYHVTMDTGSNGVPSRNELTLRINLAGYTNVVLNFVARDDFDAPDGPPPVPFINGADFDGVALSQDGTNWYEIQDLRSMSERISTSYHVDLDSAIARYGLSSQADFRIRFNQFGSMAKPIDRIVIDEVMIAGTASTIPQRLAWDVMPPWHPMGIPMPLTLTAVNASGYPVTNFNSPFNLRAYLSPTRQGEISYGTRASTLGTGSEIPCTVGIIFVPSTNLIVTHFRHYTGNKVSLWTDEGLLLASKTVISARFWREVPLDVPVELQAGQRYRLSFLSAAVDQDRDVRTPQTEGFLTITQTCSYIGDQFPAYISTVSDMIPFVGLRYSPGRLKPLDIAPTTTGQLSNGVWQGTVTFQETGEPVFLVAEDNTRRRGVSSSFAIYPWLPMAIGLPMYATEGDGILQDRGTVSLPYSPTNDVIVQLASSDTTELRVPETVLIPAGQTSAVFNLTVVDDTILDGPQWFYITATATNYTTNYAYITINDNESAVLNLLLPADILENTTVSGRVEVSAPPAEGIPVALYSSVPERVPYSFAYIEPGQTSAVFTLYAADDYYAQPTQSVAITAVVSNWIPGMATTALLDDESTNFALVVTSWEPGGAPEHAGIRSNSVLLQFGGQLQSNTVFFFTSSDTTELTVPLSITVPAGASSAFVPITLMDDMETDGAQVATLSVAAPGFRGVSMNLTVADNDPYSFDVMFSYTKETVQTSTVPFQINISARDINGSFIRTPSPPSLWLSATASLGEVKIQPTNATILNEGYWTANVMVLNGANTNVVLVASDGLGHTGQSQPFTVMAASNQVTRITSSYLEGENVVLQFTTIAGRNYRVECATSICTPSWMLVRDNIPGTGAIVTNAIPRGALPRQGFCRVGLRP